MLRVHTRACAPGVCYSDRTCPLAVGGWSALSAPLEGRQAQDPLPALRYVAQPMKQPS